MLTSYSLPPLGACRWLSRFAFLLMHGVAFGGNVAGMALSTIMFLIVYDSIQTSVSPSTSIQIGSQENVRLSATSS